MAVTETIFNEITTPPTPEGDDEYTQTVHELINDSVDFEESVLAPRRELNQAYYNGIEPAIEVPDGEENQPINRSTFISTDVRDTILTIMPSLIRIFSNFDEKVAEFVPNNEAQQAMAEQAFDYINYVFHEDNPGFLILYSVIKDALTVKGGITKWWTDTDEEVKENEYNNVSMEQVQFLYSEAPSQIEVLDAGTVNFQTGRIDGLRLRHVVSKPIIRVDAVPPDEFRVSRNAKSVDTATLVGHERMVSVSELTAKGFDHDEVSELAGTRSTYSDERFLRNEGLTDDGVEEGVLFGEWYIRVDKDGDGVAELRYIETIGNDRKIVTDEVVEYTRFAFWGVDPRPHTLIGDCLADITIDIQRIKTNMMRGQLDNLSESIRPRTVVNEMLTNLEDVLNDEVGAIIRTRGDPATAVNFSKTPYAGADVQTSIDYLDKVRASRTGITEASKGLDPKAMQSTALVGIDAIVSGAQERIELIARVLAETGLKPTVKGLLREMVSNPNPERVVKLRGTYTEINPSKFDPTMRVRVNPNLGKGTDMVRMQTLLKIEQVQLGILTKFGINNPVVSPIEYRNTIVDMLELANIMNPARYFKEVTPEIMQAIQNAPKEPDPAEVLAKAELEKVKKDMVLGIDESRRATEKLNAEIKARSEDQDFRRDKLNVDAALKLLDILTDPKQQVVTEAEARLPPSLSELNKS